MVLEYSKGIDSFYIGLIDTGAVTSPLALDSAFIYETSGDCWMVKFASPVAQTNGDLTLSIYNSAVTLSPSGICDLYLGSDNGGDPNRPQAAGSPQATSATQSTINANEWATFSFTANVTLEIGKIYYLIVHNNHASPTTNHFTPITEGAFESGTGNTSESSHLYDSFRAATSADGIASDPSFRAAIAPCAIKFDGADEEFGFPWVATESHASNANDRGNRIRFNEDVTVSGLFFPGNNSLMVNFEINEAVGGSNVATVLVEGANQAPLENDCQLGRFANVTLTGGVSYDCVITFSASSTLDAIVSMGGGTVPADVVASKPDWLLGHVTGTPGSMTLDDEKVYGMMLIIDNNPAIAGGAGGILIHPGMTGGIRG